VWNFGFEDESLFPPRINAGEASKNVRIAVEPSRNLRITNPQ
jgi:hypothetical protein